MCMWKEVTKADYISDYKIKLIFNDGVSKIFDFADLVERYDVFKPLKNKDMFKAFSITDTLEWNNGCIDIAPEYLYEHGFIL